MVDEKGSGQMIDFVLNDNGLIPVGFKPDRLAIAIKSLH